MDFSGEEGEARKVKRGVPLIVTALDDARVIWCEWDAAELCAVRTDDDLVFPEKASLLQEALVLEVCAIHWYSQFFVDGLLDKTCVH